MISLADEAISACPDTPTDNAEIRPDDGVQFMELRKRFIDSYSDDFITEPIEVREKLYAFARPPTFWPAILGCKKVEHDEMPGTMEVAWVCAAETRRLDEHSVMLLKEDGMKKYCSRMSDEVWKSRAEPSGYAAHIWKQLVKVTTKPMLPRVSTDNTQGMPNMPKRAQPARWEELKRRMKAYDMRKKVPSDSTNKDIKGVIKRNAMKVHVHKPCFVLERQLESKNPHADTVSSETLKRLRLLIHAARSAQWPSMDTLWTQHADNCFRQPKSFDIKVVKIGSKRKASEAQLLSDSEIAMMAIPAHRKPWWNHDSYKSKSKDAPSNAAPDVSSENLGATGSATNDAVSESTVRVDDVTATMALEPEKGEARAVDPDVANSLSTSSAKREPSGTRRPRSPEPHHHVAELDGSSDDSSAHGTLGNKRKRRKLAQAEKRMKRKMAPESAESRRSLKKIRTWTHGEPLVHNTVTELISEHHNLWDGPSYSWQRVSTNCVYGIPSVNGWAESVLTHKTLVDWPEKHKTLFNAWIDPKYATSASMSSPKYRRNEETKKIFNLPENDEWVDAKLASDTTEAFRVIEAAITKNITNDHTRKLRMARHLPVALALTDDLWNELLVQEEWKERPYFSLLIINTVLDSIHRLLRSEGLLTMEESPWFQHNFDCDAEDDMCILPTDGGGNADIDRVLALINHMRLIINYAKMFPDDPPIGLMDIIHWIRIAKRMEFRVCWIMPVASTEAAPFWEDALKWSIPVRHPCSNRKGLNTVDYFDAKAFLFESKALSIAAWNGNADPSRMELSTEQSVVYALAFPYPETI